MRGRMKIIMGALLLVTIAAAALLPLSKVQAESTAGQDFQMRGDTLMKYTGTAAAVSIPTSVKHIGKEAFAGHDEIVKIDIPAYVKDIDYRAFAGCSSLKMIAVPDTVTSIGIDAFSGCTALQSIAIGKGMESIGTGAFANCTSLETMKISKANTKFSYDKGVLYSKDKKILYAMLPGYKSDVYQMPSSVEEMKGSAFWGCMNLIKAEIGSNVKKISDYAFANCQNLDKVLIPYSVTGIGQRAFADCIQLGDTEIPESVEEIHKTAFDGCPNVNIIAADGSRAAEYSAARDQSNVAAIEYQDIGSDTMNSEATQDHMQEAQKDDVNQEAQKDDVNQEANTQEAPAGKVLGQSTVVGGSAVVFMDNGRSNVMTGNTLPGGDQAGSATAEVMNSNMQKGGFPKYTIINNSKIAAQAYYGDSSLTAYHMPKTINAIGDFAFSRSGITSAVIPEGTETIGYGAFYHCDALTDIVIPDTVKEIEASAFAKTPWMDARMTDRKNPFTIVGDGILIAYAGRTDHVEIPEGVKQIGAEVFRDKTFINSVKLPESLTIIGEDAFAGCRQLAAVTGGDKVEQIRDRAFEGCPMNTIKIPASVSKIGLRAYDQSGTEQTDAARTAVFLGTEIPTVSYEKTATRLANESYRDAVFKGVKVAIVDESIVSPSDLNNTVLDYDAGGFRGFVCGVDQAAQGDVPGKLRIKFCVMKEADVQETTIPPVITVYGKNYEIVNPEDAVVYASEEQKAEEKEGAVTVRTDSVTMPQTPSAAAEMEGNERDYILSISDNTTAGSAIETAYKRTAAGNRMTSLQVYDLTLYDAVTMIPISKLGNQKLIVTVPKPKGLLTDQIKVLCLDEDGQLEQVESHIINEGGETSVQFTAKHFSVYAFYN